MLKPLRVSRYPTLLIHRNLEDGRVYMFGRCARQVSGQFGNELLQPVLLVNCP